MVTRYDKETTGHHQSSCIIYIKYDPKFILQSYSKRKHEILTSASLDMDLAVLVAANITTEDRMHFGLIEPWTWHCVVAARSGMRWTLSVQAHV